MYIGHIYKIVHKHSSVVYIGSTKNDINIRYCQHTITGGCTINKLMREHGRDNFIIVLIKSYEVIDRKHLEAYELLWKNKHKTSINRNDSFGLGYMLTKTDYHKAYNKTYRDNNKKKINEYLKQYNKQICKCDICGKVLKRGSLYNHKKIMH